MRNTALVHLSLAALLTACSGSPDGAPAADTATSPSRDTASAATVYRGFSLFDGRGDSQRPDSAMLVADGRVAWIGAAADLAASADAEVVDLDGKYVIPGLIDLHVHVGVLSGFAMTDTVFTRDNIERELRTYASYGVTSVMTQGTDKDLVYTLIDEQQSGTPAYSRLFSGGQGVVFEGGYGGVAGINDPAATPAEAAAVVAAQAASGADLVKVWVDDEFGTMPPMPAAVSQAAIDAAHEHGLRAVAHVFYREDAKRLVAEGIDGFVHSVRDQAVDEALVDAMRAAGTWQVSLTLSREAAMFAYGEGADFLDDPFFARSVPEDVRNRLASDEYRATVRGGPHYGEYPGILETAQRNAKALLDAGVNVAFGTDSGPPGRFAGYSAHWELGLMVEAGYTPAQALAAATSRAAEFLGTPDLGVLAPGRHADFVVLGADPLADIAHTRRIEAVYIGGRRVD